MGQSNLQVDIHDIGIRGIAILFPTGDAITIKIISRIVWIGRIQTMETFPNIRHTIMVII